MFHVGQLVVCVDATTPNRDGVAPAELVRGCVYTVTGFPNETGLSVAEVKPECGYEAFYRWRFRPVSDAKLVVFRAMLAPRPKEPVGA